MKNLLVFATLLLAFILSSCNKENNPLQENELKEIFEQEYFLESRNSEEELVRKIAKWEYMHLTYYRDYDPYMYLPEKHRANFSDAFEYIQEKGMNSYLIREYKKGTIDRTRLNELLTLHGDLENAISNNTLKEYLNDYRINRINQNARSGTSSPTTQTASDVITDGLAIWVQAQATCSDGIQNQGETAADCGGPCPNCSTCDDGIQNGNETGIDCGGTCTPCANCNDGIQNGNEIAIDCGGYCPPCNDGSSPTCVDGIQNGAETGIDCGGYCPSCEEEGDTIEERGCDDIVNNAAGTGAIVGAIVLGSASGITCILSGVPGEICAVPGAFIGAGIGAGIGALIGLIECNSDDYELCSAPTGITILPPSNCSTTTVASLAGHGLGNGSILKDFKWSGQNVILNGVTNPIDIRTTGASVTFTAINIEQSVSITGGPICDDPTTEGTSEDIWYSTSRSIDFLNFLEDPAPVSIGSNSGHSEFSIGNTDSFIIYGYNQYNNPNVEINISMSPTIGGITNNGDGSFNVRWFSSGTTTITITATNVCSGQQEQDSITVNVSQ